MSPVHDFRCRECGFIFEQEYSIAKSPPPVIDTLCAGCFDEEGKLMISRFDRVWNAPAIGAVMGAGMSPARARAASQIREQTYKQLEAQGE